MYVYMCVCVYVCVCVCMNSVQKERKSYTVTDVIFSEKKVPINMSNIQKHAYDVM